MSLLDEENDLPESSDSEDEDFIPGREPNDVSEEEEDGDPEVKKSIKKKKKNGRAGGNRKARKRRGVQDSEEDSDDDETDADFVIEDKTSKSEESKVITEDPEVVAARDKAEKERTDVLWTDFLNSVETMKAKKKGGSSNSKEETVTKVYDFAGEKVEVQEKMKVSAEDSETRSSTSSSISFATESPNSVENGPYKLYLSGGNSLILSGISGSSNKPPPPKRLRISFLSGDPADIGLAGDKKVSAKEGIANVLNALQARNKKLGTLDKSKLDWEKYKNQQGIQEELESHTKSKHGFIDKQEFLQRADHRQFELEKDARAKRRRNI